MEPVVATTGENGAAVRAALARLSRTGELPAMPGVATSALTIARDPQADVDALCQAIQRDVGIAARVLRVANSAVYGRRTTCASLRDAVTTVGFRTMQDILSAAALRSVVDLNDPEAKALWEHSLAVAIAAEHLGAATGTVRRGGAFFAGLFHDVGRIIYLVSAPEAYAGILHAPEGDLCARERAWVGFDHAEAGAAIAAQWGLPGEVCEVVRWHHDPAGAPAASALVRLVATADVLVGRLGIAAGDATEVPGGEVAPERHDEVGPAILAAFESERTLFA